MLAGLKRLLVLILLLLGIADSVHAAGVVNCDEAAAELYDEKASSKKIELVLQEFFSSKISIIEVQDVLKGMQVSGSIFVGKYVDPTTLNCRLSINADDGTFGFAVHVLVTKVDSAHALILLKIFNELPNVCIDIRY